MRHEQVLLSALIVKHDVPQVDITSIIDQHVGECTGEFDVVDVDIDLTGHPWFFVVATHVDDAVVAGAYPGVQAENIGERSWVVTASNRDGPPDFETATRTSDSENALIRGTWIIRGNLEP